VTGTTTTPVRRDTAVDQTTTESSPLQVVRRGLLRRPLLGGVDILGSRLRREFDLNTHSGETARFCVRGLAGTALVCLDDRILILKRGFYAGTTFGAISATIYYADVTGIQVGRHLLSGWIEIHSPSFQGGGDGKRASQHAPARTAFKQPNCLPIRRRRTSTYQLALVELRHLVADAKLDHEHLPVVDQLERLAMLRRRGDVDQREFELAKARILRDDASAHWDRAAASS
jgi:hypothetical protein